MQVENEFSPEAPSERRNDHSPALTEIPSLRNGRSLFLPHCIARSTRDFPRTVYNPR